MVFIKPAEGFSGTHVYASDGTWAFDHNGWTHEKELLRLTELAYTEKYPGWAYTRICIDDSMSSLEEFCKKYTHRLPWQFARLPWERAYAYIKQFPERPPTDVPLI